MTWDTIALLIAQYGIPFAETLWLKWSGGAAPTAQDWADLKALAKQSARDRLLAALARAGIDPASDQAKLLLAAVGP